MSRVKSFRFSDSPEDQAFGDRLLNALSFNERRCLRCDGPVPLDRQCDCRGNVDLDESMTPPSLAPLSMMETPIRCAICAAPLPPFGIFERCETCRGEAD